MEVIVKELSGYDISYQLAECGRFFEKKGISAGG